jgi:hypothetical protein
MSRVTRRRGAALCALAAALICLPATDAAAKRDRTKPVVRFKMPTAGASVSGALSGATCRAWARDRSRVARVKFYVDRRTLAVDRAAPYTCAWDTTGVRAGRHRLTARAVDRSGNATSTTVAIRVVRTKPAPKPTPNSTPPPPTPTPAPTPTPTPTPSPTPTPTPTPAPMDFPNASSTGVPAGTTLTAYTGPSTISTPGTVVDGKIMGCVRVTAPGVVIRKSKISCASDYAVYNRDGDYGGTPLFVEDSEIDCKNTSGTGIGEANFTARRVNIHGCENGGDMNQAIVIEDSYIHDLASVGADPHEDGLQLAWGHIENGRVVDGARNLKLVHNTIYGINANGSFGTSAIISNGGNAGNGRDSDILIQNNLLAGGAFTLYCDQGGIAGNNFRVLGNHFSRKFKTTVGFYGTSDSCSDETQSGNVIHETGQPLLLP